MPFLQSVLLMKLVFGLETVLDLGQSIGSCSRTSCLWRPASIKDFLHNAKACNQVLLHCVVLIIESNDGSFSLLLLPLTRHHFKVNFIFLHDLGMLTLNLSQVLLEDSVHELILVASSTLFHRDSGIVDLHLEQPSLLIETTSG